MGLVVWEASTLDPTTDPEEAHIIRERVELPETSLLLLHSSLSGEGLRRGVD